MNKDELLWFIFTDELVASLIFPFNQRYVLDTSIIFREDIINISFYIYAYLGAYLGCILNYYFGKLMQYGLSLPIKLGKKIKFTLMMSLFLLPINYFGPIFSFLCGFGYINRIRFMTISAIILFANYSAKYVIMLSNP